jgi:hypothetical protein
MGSFLSTLELPIERIASMDCSDNPEHRSRPTFDPERNGVPCPDPDLPQQCPLTHNAVSGGQVAIAGNAIKRPTANAPKSPPESLLDQGVPMPGFVSGQVQHDIWFICLK